MASCHSHPQGDAKMMEILKFTHQFLQKFCAGNQENQALLHKHLNLFLTPGVRRGHRGVVGGSSTGREFGTAPGAESKGMEISGDAGEDEAGQELGTVPAAP